VLLISYDLLKRRLPTELQDRYGIIICDECHAMKKDSGRTQFVGPMVKRAPRALLLSGTPVTSRPIEAYYQVRVWVTGCGVGWGSGWVWVYVGGCGCGVGDWVYVGGNGRVLLVGGCLGGDGPQSIHMPAPVCAHCPYWKRSQC
jgi:hypothetical protein